jgi:hypothetical protein
MEHTPNCLATVRLLAHALEFLAPVDGELATALAEEIIKLSGWDLMGTVSRSRMALPFALEYFLLIGDATALVEDHRLREEMGKVVMASGR